MDWRKESNNFGNFNYTGQRGGAERGERAYPHIKGKEKVNDASSHLFPTLTKNVVLISLWRLEQVRGYIFGVKDTYNVRQTVRCQILRSR